MEWVTFPVNILPIPPADLVGRDAVVQDLLDRLLHQQSVLIPGPRRTGKTAVALELLRQAHAEHHALTGLVDLFTCTDARDVARQLMAACLRNVDAAWTRRQFTWDRDIALGLRNASGLVRVLGLDLIQWAFHLDQLDTAELLDHALDFPERLAERLGRPMLLIWDEFQEVGTLDGAALIKRMRAHWQRQRRTAYGFLGSQGGIMRDLFGQSRQPLYRFADILPLPPIPVTTWMDYAQAKFTAAGYTVVPEALEALVTRTGGHPFDTMKVLQHLARLAYQHAIPTISRDLAWLAYQDTTEELRRYFEAEIGGLSIAHARTMLLRLARGQSVYIPGLNASQNKRTVDALIAAGILSKTGRGRYRFEEPMLAAFLAQTE